MYTHEGFPLAVYTWGHLSSHRGGGKVQGDKALMGGTHEGRHRPYGGT